MAFENNDALVSLINFVEVKGTVRLLDALLVEFKQEIGRLADSLRRLLHVSFPEVRARIVRSLTQRWVPLLDALKLAQEAVNDPDPNVRSTAVGTLRDLNRA